MLKRILIYGTMAGLAVGAMLYATTAAPWGMPHGAVGMLIGYTTMLIALSLVFVGIKRQRDDAGGGVIGFWSAFGMGLGISVVAGIFYVLAWELAQATTVAGFIDSYTAALIADKKAAGASAAELARYTAEMKAFAAQGRMPIINAMSDVEHPTQAVTDLAALQEHFGTLQGLHVLYIGDGDNTTASLALAFGMLPGMRLTIVTPEGYGLPQDLLDQAAAYCRESGSTVEQHHRMDDLPQGVDVVYTTRWLTMGVAKKDADWLTHFRPYTITPEVMERVSKPGTIFMHDLPAMRGYEVVDEVLDGPQSIAFRQAFHKMTSAMAILAWCAGGGDRA